MRSHRQAGSGTRRAGSGRGLYRPGTRRAGSAPCLADCTRMGNIIATAGGGEEEGGGGCSGLNWWQPDQSLLGESAGSNENRLGSGKGREGGRSGV